MKSEVKKGKITTKLPKKINMDFATKPTRKVQTKIQADDPQFIPKFNCEEHCDLVGNIPLNYNNEKKLILNPHANAIIDCGFKMDKTPGFVPVVKDTAKLAALGVFVRVVQGERFTLYVNNLGRTIVTITHLDVVGHLSLVPNHVHSWIIGE